MSKGVVPSFTFKSIGSVLVAASAPASSTADHAMHGYVRSPRKSQLAIKLPYPTKHLGNKIDVVTRPNIFWKRTQNVLGPK